MDSSFRNRIIKLLNLSTSPNDHEALVAVRTANDSLKRNGLTWDVLLSDSLETPPQKPKGKSYSPEDTIEEMIGFIYENAWDDFDFEFIDSIQEWYESHGNLTYKQVKGLRSVYEKVMEYEKEGDKL